MTTATARRRSQSALGWDRRPDVPVEEFDVLRTWHPNVLICGLPEETAAAIEALRGIFRPIVAGWNPDATLPLPPDDGARTLILHDVDALSPDEQRQLLGWLLHKPVRTVQVVATTARPLWPLVESGRFDPSLYYALNVVYLNLSS